jgi:outer membrane murein-binding lipoprotein Lpp
VQFFSKTLTVLFGLALLGAVGLGGYWTLQWVFGLFLRLDSQIAAVTGIATVVMLLAAAIIASRIGGASRQSKTNQLFTEKAATYDLFIDLWGSLFLAGHAGDRNSEQLAEEFRTLDRQLLLYGGANAVKAHVALQALWREGRMSQSKGWDEFLKALVAIRKDLGSDEPGLTLEDLRQLLLPDASPPDLLSRSKDPQTNEVLTPKA